MAIFRGGGDPGVAAGGVTNAVPDGDYGNISVSNDGGIWTIDNGVVETANLGGDITTAGKALLDDATAADQRTTLGLGSIATQDSNNVTITGGSVTVPDNTFIIQDNLDATKQVQFQASGLTTATTRTLTVPDANTTLVGTGATQTLTNKTISLGSNTISGTRAQFNSAVTDGDIVFETSSTGSVLLPVGTTAQRDGSPTTGYFRFNSDVAKFEGYNGTAWGSVGGGATGSGGDEVFIENDQTVTTNYTIPTGRNAMTTGPITINSGVYVTVSAGSMWVVL